jgi:peptide/nickel transport system substrate-binding protein
VARPLVLAAAIAAALLAVSGAGGAPAQTPKRGGTVTVSQGLFSPPPCLNVLLPKCNFANSYAQEILEGAFEAGPDSVLRENLVSQVDFTRTPPFTLTYHIRPEARWSDGVPITARDFVFTHLAILKHDTPEFVQFYRERVRRVSAFDAKTVRVVLRRRYAGWRGGLFWIVLPRHALLGEDLESVWTNRIDNPKTGEPIGSGPFVVEQWERGKGVDQLTLARNPSYWGRHPAYLDRVILRVVAPGEFRDAIEAMERRAVDVVNGSIPSPDTVLRFRQLSGVRVVSSSGLNWQHLLLRVGPGGHPALRDKRVRRALAYGIDRAGIPAALYSRVAPTLTVSDSAVFPTASPYYRPNWRVFRHRPAESRSLLEQAGCRRGADGVYACGGERLRLRVLATPSTRNQETIPLLQSQLRRVGIEVLPEFAAQAAVEQIVEEGNFDLVLWQLAFTPDAVDLVAFYGCGAAANFTGYCQRLVTADLDQADRILDLEQRARALNRGDARMAKDVPVIPLYQVPTYAAVRSKIRGYVPSFPYPLWGAENWWLDR